MMVATLVRYDMISSPSLLNVLVCLLNLFILLGLKVYVLLYGLFVGGGVTLILSTSACYIYVKVYNYLIKANKKCFFFNLFLIFFSLFLVSYKIA